ncbi:hypothetical protein THMA_1045 [Thermotoga maritima MSB8]|jgi:hypothetical protein|uniref:Peptidase S24/S26A/S26B/S26C domain-containing protein n=1 Tax=Thermotoga maritima (strain ATCC 43589 / DSM 3109 / JCM 10099 / NBRC 100826 / MSB8) TaxID=243274 RepID=Q9X0B4_THEMA|nr:MULTISPECIES: S24 family peptidase [Thermotoga]AAD36101.1 hypothetical protein TM_1024 [Thermotoga maritima MSB8]AGL49950.1 hypothetical protein Tmari_1026 [Thermotoga maritima MSB8]AHD19068.1 hypothetical protein THEMA_09240 [Thermotoga maritima MSB8]AIY87305.1 hypothetical protein T2812B_08920 [Thermotoga sp. 2812B]AKE26935.1 hypothetical protein THMC_1045 [Thermotoga maritima]
MEEKVEFILEVRSIPVYGDEFSPRLRKFFPIDYEPVERVTVPTSKKADYAVMISSNLKPFSIKEGDYILISLDDEPQEGDLVAVLVKDFRITVGRVKERQEDIFVVEVGNEVGIYRCFIFPYLDQLHRSSFELSFNPYVLGKITAILRKKPAH